MFVDDLKLYPESHKTLKDVIEMIVHESNETGACYGVVKCAETIFEKGKMVKDEDLQVLNERMKIMDPMRMRYTSSQESRKLMVLRQKKCIAE